MRERRYIAFAGLVTLFGLGGAGILLVRFVQHRSLYVLIFNGIDPIPNQFIYGTVYAILSSVVLLFFLRLKMLRNTNRFFEGLIEKYKVSYIAVVLLSLCAGIGEELLFRGAIQYWLGIWPTAFIFILLHGYLNPKDRPLFMYGMVLLVVSAGFGYLATTSGIIAAMTAHFLIDVVLLVYLKRNSAV